MLKKIMLHWQKYYGVQFVQVQTPHSTIYLKCMISFKKNGLLDSHSSDHLKSSS